MVEAIHHLAEGAHDDPRRSNFLHTLGKPRWVERRELDIRLDPTADLAVSALARPRKRVGVRRARSGEAPRRTGAPPHALHPPEERTADALSPVCSSDA